MKKNAAIRGLGTTMIEWSLKKAIMIDKLRMHLHVIFLKTD